MSLYFKIPFSEKSFRNELITEMIRKDTKQLKNNVSPDALIEGVLIQPDKMLVLLSFFEKITT